MPIKSNHSIVPPYVYDIETYPNIFTMTMYNGTKKFRYEVSEVQNDWSRLRLTLDALAAKQVEMVGFNNVGFDYPVLHHLMAHCASPTDAGRVVTMAYRQSQKIIKAQNNDDKFANIIWSNQRLIPQIDLMAIYHFDNNARRTSLKMLEVNMRSETVEDLPFKTGQPIELTDANRKLLLDYNDHDVMRTWDFYQLKETQQMIAFRREMSAKYSQDFMSFNDTQIGKAFFINALENSLGGDICFYRDETGKRHKRQTHRDQIALNDIIFDYIRFDRPEFQAVHDFLKSRVITETKGVFSGIPVDELTNSKLDQYCVMPTPKKSKKAATKTPRLKNINTVVDGLEVIYGTGGLHASQPPSIWRASKTHRIIDVDVTSLYPSIAIVNRLYPEHLTEKFADVYAELKRERLKHVKGSTTNAMLKLALNGVYGFSNSIYTPFYDPAFTMSITVNGQLLLSMLAEQLLSIEGLTIMQINTDGITAYVPIDQVKAFELVCESWEIQTSLDLESVEFSAFYLRDVNNYLGIMTDGKIKRKGAYEYDVDWHQNHSSLVIQKAVEHAFVNNNPTRETVEDYIINHNDMWDFFINAKIPKGSRLMHGDEQIQNISRYYVATTDHPEAAALTKIMPPLKKKLEAGITDERHFAVQKEQVVVVRNTYRGEFLNHINYCYYIDEAMKLIDPLVKDKNE